MKLISALLALFVSTTACANEVYYPQAAQPGSPPCVAPRVCLWVDSANGQLMIRDSSGASEKVRAARSFRTSANCAALAAPANGDICYDTDLSAFRLYSGGWTTPSVDDALLVHKAGVETITGAKTFSSAITMGGVKITGLAQATASGDAVHGGRLLTATSPLRIDASASANLTADRTLSLVAGGLAYQTVTGGASGLLGVATLYLRSPGHVAYSAAETVLALSPRSATARSLVCFVGTAPGGVDSVITTVRINGVDSAVNCTIAGVLTSCADSVNTAAIAAGDRLSIKSVASASAAVADLTCTFEAGN